MISVMVRVLQKPLERAEPERIVFDLANDGGALIDRQDQILRIDDPRQFRPHQVVEHRLGHAQGH